MTPSAQAQQLTYTLKYMIKYLVSLRNIDDDHASVFCLLTLLFLLMPKLSIQNELNIIGSGLLFDRD